MATKKSIIRVTINEWAFCQTMRNTAMAADAKTPPPEFEGNAVIEARVERMANLNIAFLSTDVTETLRAQGRIV